VSSLGSVTFSLRDTGRTRKNSSNSISLGFIDDASRTPRKCLKNKAAAILISISARCSPRHKRAPAPKGHQATFAKGESFDAFSGSHLVWSNLYALVIVTFQKQQPILLRVRKRLRVSMQTIRLCRHPESSGQLVTAQICSFRRHHARQAAWYSAMSPH